jgi:hypothetical protein
LTPWKPVAVGSNASSYRKRTCWIDQEGKRGAFLDWVRIGSLEPLFHPFSSRGKGSKSCPKRQWAMAIHSLPVCLQLRSFYPLLPCHLLSSFCLHPSFWSQISCLFLLLNLSSKNNSSFFLHIFNTISSPTDHALFLWTTFCFSSLLESLVHLTGECPG